MAESAHNPEPDADLPAPGQRWGTGAHSVLPYLTRTLQAKPASSEPREHHPSDSQSGRASEQPQAN